MRIVVDTNVVVSGAISAKGAPAEILRRWRQGQFELLVSEPMLAEYERALSYGRVRARHQMSQAEIHALVTQFRRFAILVEPLARLQVVTDDPDDDKFLECAVTGGAAYIVSGDPHLLAVKHYQGIQILSPAAFVAFLNTASP